MTGVDGYQAIQEIRKINGFENLPIIALTAKVMIEDRNKALQLGFSDFISKPVDNDRLLAIIGKWIQKKRG